MDPLPPEGSLRRRTARAFFLVLTAVVAYVLVHDALDWLTLNVRVERATKQLVDAGPAPVVVIA